MSIQAFKRCLICIFNHIVLFFKIGYGPLKDFKSCSKRITELRCLGLLSEEDFLILYGLYKQVKFGDCKTDDDEGLTVEQVKRRESWLKLKGITTKKAVHDYIDIAKKVLEKKDVSSLETSSAIVSRILLVESEDNFEYDEFFTMISEGELDKVKEFIKNNPDKVCLKSPEGLTPLHLAADRGNIDLVKFLLENGADINAVDENGDAPLHVAVESQVKNVIQFLIESGADVDLRNFEGVSSKDLMNLEYE